MLSEEQARLINDRLTTKDDLALLGKEVRREIGDLRKDMDAKFAGVDAKLIAMEERSDAKHELLRTDMNAKHESLRKDMELMSARFEKRLLLVGVALGTLTLFGQDTLSALLRLFH